MTKSLARTKDNKPKTAGRPQAPLQDYFTNIKEYLELGFSLHKSCQLANVPYMTVLDYYNGDNNFRGRVDAIKSNPVLVSRRALVKEAEEKDWGKTDAHRYILDNLDEEIKAGRGGNINIVAQNMNLDFIKLDE